MITLLFDFCSKIKEIKSFDILFRMHSTEPKPASQPAHQPTFILRFPLSFRPSPTYLYTKSSCLLARAYLCVYVCCVISLCDFDDDECRGGGKNKVHTAMPLTDQHHHHSHDVRGFGSSDINGNNSSINARVGGTHAARSAKKAAAAERVVDEAVDAAILARKEQEPEKWEKVQCNAPAQPSDGSGAAGVSGDGDGGAGGVAAGAGSSEAGGSRCVRRFLEA